MAEAKESKGKMKTPVFRVHFPSVFEMAKPMEGSTGKPAYEITGTVDPAQFTPAEKLLWLAIRDEANRQCVEKFKKPLKEITLPKFNFPWYDAGAKDHLGGFIAGHIAFKMKTWSKPGVVGPDGRTPLTEAAQLYAGCYARATVAIQAYDKNGGKGVAIRLNNVMFVRDGERLDGRTAPEDDFGDMGETPVAGASDDDLM